MNNLTFSQTPRKHGKCHHHHHHTVPVIHNHCGFLYHTTFIQLTQGLLFSAHNLSTYIHNLLNTFLFLTLKPPNQLKNENVKTDSMQLREKVCKTAASTLEDLSFYRQNTLGWHFLWIKFVFVLKYLYSITLSYFTPSICKSGAARAFFLKSTFVFMTLRSSQLSLHQVLSLSTST